MTWATVGGLVGRDGVVNVVDETADTPVQAEDRGAGRLGAHGVEPCRSDGVHLVEGAQVARREPAVVDDAGEGRGEVAPGVVAAMPLDRGGGDGMSGRAAQTLARLARPANRKLKRRSVEVDVAVFQVVGYGSNGQGSFIDVGVPSARGDARVPPTVDWAVQGFVWDGLLGTVIGICEGKGRISLRCQHTAGLVRNI